MVEIQRTDQDNAQLLLNLIRNRTPFTNTDWWVIDAWALQVLKRSSAAPEQGEKK